MENTEKFRHALLSLDRLGAEAVLREVRHAEGGVHWVESVVTPALESIGEDWDKGRLALSQVYTSGRLCEELVTQLLDSDTTPSETPVRTALVVLDDYHMLGKRIVHSMLRASGHEVLDYGRMAGEALVERVRQDGVEVLLISTLMLNAALAVKQVRADLGDTVKIVVGGAPFRLDPELWKAVGADAMGRTASDAVSLLVKLLEEKR